MDDYEDQPTEAELDAKRSARIRSLILNGLALAIMAVACVFMFGEFAWQIGVIIFFVGVIVMILANAGGD